MLDDSSAYIRSEVLAVTDSTRGKIQTLLDSGVCLPDRPRDGTQLRWSASEIALASIALKLSRLGLLLTAIRPAIDAARAELQAGPLAVLMVEFDNAGRFKAATRLDSVVPLGGLAAPSEVPAGAGFRLLIDIAAEVRTIDAKLQAHRADHGAARRGPRACRKSA